jgi:hypothetical protein
MSFRNRNSRAGGALVTVMLMVFVASAVMGSYLAYSSQAAHSTMRMIDYQKAQIAAESGLEYGLMCLKETIVNNHLSLTRDQIQTVLDTMPPPPAIGGYVFRTPRSANAFEIKADTDVIVDVITNGSACAGSEGEYEMFTITAGALNPGTGVGAVLQQRLQGVGLFLVRYAVFYDDDLEMNPGAPMTITGPVHCNADIYVAPDNSTLRCDDRVTSVGDMFRHRKDTSARGGYVGINDANNSERPMDIDSDSSDWMIEALNRWKGRVRSQAHGVQYLRPPINPMDDPHDLIERPIAAGNPGYHVQTENEKFANKACLVIRVLSNGTFTARDFNNVDRSSLFTNAVLLTNGVFFNGRPEYAKDAMGSYLFKTGGAYRAGTNTFMDRRENAQMLPVDIYMNIFTQSFQAAGTNYTIPQGRGVIYVTRDDPDGVSNGVIPCVRIRNASVLSQGGLSIASDLPIYVEGHCNTTNTQPALVVGDAVTFLSSKWQDARTWTVSLNDRIAEPTTYRVVVMTGNNETTRGGYNGGLENVLRFQENWSGKTVTFRGSVIDLWHTEVVHGAWVYGGYYTAPNRDWGYDAMYRSRVPPGMTRVFGLEEIEWVDSSWDQVGWN